jgi:hypothetical protein
MAFFGHKGGLTIPPDAAKDTKAVELARVWAAGGKQHVALRADVWSDPAAWGIMLADLARHVARALEQTQGQPQAKTLARIRAGFDAEWTSPTDRPTGKIE